MSQADSIHTTRTSADTSRRHFLLFASVASAAGAGSLAVAAMPLPATAPVLQCSTGKASPALREALIELDAAHTALEAAKARFLADDMKMVEWDKANPEPQGKRAKRRHVRKWNEVREATVRESWDAQLAAEDRFQYARVAVANVAPQGQSDLHLKVAASVAYDDVHTAGYLRNGLIAQSVVADFFKQNMA
jgi:hypothetical protein